jgi:hypothetical protein
MTELKTGVYRHFKGQEYEVLGIAKHSETEEPLVVYKSLYGDKALWVRPVNMFLGTKDIDGVAVRRFEYMGENNP